MRSFLQIVVLFLLSVNISYSQSSTVNYDFTNSSSGSLTDMSSGATNLLIPSSTTGEFVSALAPIGFDFWLMGVRHAYFSVNSNGLMRLGKTLVTNSNSNTLANSNTNTPSLYAFWDNLNSYTASSTSRVRYKINGVLPNRVLTVEWKDFIISNNSSNGIQTSTWQIRLYETTGVFEYVYGRMQVATGSNTVTASIGMTYANVVNNLIFLNTISPVTVLRTTAFQSNLVNTSTVGNITALNSVSNGNRVQYTFTPKLPTAAPSALTFTAVGNSNMTLNWVDNSTNERGFVIYRSDDGGITYNFASQVAANATTAVQTALSPSTTYFWKVYAVTEGALSNPVAGSQATTACFGAPPTNTLLVTGTGATVLWNTPAAWSLGHVPTACENAVITFSRTSNGNVTYIISMNVSASVNNLTINGNYGGSGNKVLQILTNANALTVLGNLTISASGGSGSTSEAGLLASTGSVVMVKGNSIIGQVGDTKETYIGGVASQDPDFYFKGDITFNNLSSSSYPGTYYFDGGGTQSFINNAINNYIVFGEVEIGKLLTTSLTLSGTYAADTYTNMGNLTINSNSTLVLPYDAAFNQFTANNGGLILKANSTLKLGDNFGGQPGSNFPADYSYISIDKSSTVEYYAISPYNQVIYTDVIYGNLTLTNNSRKYINASLIIDGNLTNNVGSTFGCDELTVLFGASFINNGIVDGLYTNSEFGFYGDAAQNYSGTGLFGTAGTPFGSWGVDIYNPANVTLNASIYTQRLNLFNGKFINSNQLNIGSATFGLVQRGGVTGENAGEFDTYPAIISVNNYYVRYDEANAVTTGPEIPVTGKTYNVYANNPNGVSITSNLNVTNDLQLIQNTLNLNANTLQVGNLITKTGGNINGSAGSLEMNGTTAQTIPDNTFQNNNLKNLVISNTNNVTGVTLADTLDVYRSVTFGPGGRKLTTGGFLSLKSTATETAWLGQMTASNSIVGNTTVERYIPLHSKAWQFLAVPATGQTVNAAWQEGNAPLSTALNPGYGTLITSNYAGAGFDINGGSGPSMMTYDTTAKTFLGIPNTTIPIYNRKGYMLFVRGNRTVANIITPATSANLRTKGTLFTPATPPAVINLAANTFESVGNPYASAIDLTALNITGGVQDVFYVWDPKLTTAPSAYGFGAYQTFTRNGATYDVTPGGGSYATGTCKTIESGQAFFVRAPSAPGSVTFAENCKVNGSRDVNRVPVSNESQLRTNLYVITGNDRVLLDGNLVQFDHSFSNETGMEDALKIGNTGENLGITSKGNILVVERRKPVQRTDTLFYNLGKVRVKQYQVELIPRGMAQEGLEAYLEDKYLGTRTAVDLRDTSLISFNVVNVPGSYATDRFRLLFKINKKSRQEIPVKDIRETVKNNDISGKGVVSVDADKQSDSGNKPTITVYPNPVENKNIQVQFLNIESGQYSIQVINHAGQQVYNGPEMLYGKNNSRQIQLDRSLPAGVYQLIITSATGYIITQNVVIK